MNSAWSSKIDLPEANAPLPSLWQALAIMGVAMLVVAVGWHRMEDPKPSQVPGEAAQTLDLILSGDGRATLEETTFPLKDLPDVLAKQTPSGRLADIKVTAPRDLALPVLLDVMTVLRDAGIQKTSVHLEEALEKPADDD